jgi:small multidrug resistance family-3 protein
VASRQGRPRPAAVFIIGSLARGMAFDGFRPDRFDLAGAAVCLVGVVVIMYAPR